MAVDKVHGFLGIRYFALSTLLIKYVFRWVMMFAGFQLKTIRCCKGCFCCLCNMACCKSKEKLNPKDERTKRIAHGRRVQCIVLPVIYILNLAFTIVLWPLLWMLCSFRAL